MKGTPFEPQICLVDGFGVLHPRACGTHLGVHTGMPTIGVAKRLLRQCCNLTETDVMDQLSRSGQLTLDLTSSDGAVIGCSVRRNLQARQPVYVSVGHRVSLATACDIVHGCCLHRIPEPIRQADLLARATVRLRAGAETCV